MGRGNVTAFSSLPLNDVLFIPTLTSNLISVKKLVHALDCDVVFSRSGCVIQEQGSGTTIGRGKERGDLYVLENSHPTATYLSTPKTPQL